MKNQEFIFKSIVALSEDYFIFMSVSNDGFNFKVGRPYRKGDIILVESKHDCDLFGDEDLRAVCGVDIKNIEDVIAMHPKKTFTCEEVYNKTDNFNVEKRNLTNKCPLTTKNLKNLLDENYISVETVDGSCGWVTDSCEELEFSGTDKEELLIAITFGDGSFEWTYSSNIKRIISTQYRKVN